MEETNVFVDPLLSCEVLNRKFQLLLNASNEQRAFTGQKETKVRAIVANINSRLNQLELRPIGVQLLKIFLTHCQDQVFVEHSVTWMTQCLNAAVNPEIGEEAYDVLRMLINMSHNFQELTKSITGTVIPKLLDQLLKTRKSIAALQCLQVTLHHYPGPCKMKFNSIKNFLMGFLDEEEKLLVEHAGRCMCYLPLLLTSDQKKGSEWTVLLTELCATANTIIYELFVNIHEVVMPSGLTELSDGYKLSSNKSGTVESYSLTATRVINILKFVEGMLLGDLDQVKAVRADILVALAYRLLAVNCKMVCRNRTMEHVALASVLPDVHVATFNMLQNLVSCCPGGLIKYGPLFCKLVLQTLKWTSNSSGYGEERPYRHLREAAYTFLQNWMLRASAASCVELLADELVSLMLTDVFMQKETVTLQFQEKGTMAFSKTLLRRGKQKLADPKANAGPCEAALLALCALVQTSGSLLKPAVHMRLQEITVSILLDIRRASGPEYHLFPFKVAGCRVQLYRLLLVLLLHPHPQWPPPTQFALSLFAWGQHDSALEVAGFCNLALACSRQMVHPSQSSHQFPLSVDEMRSSVGLHVHDPVQDLQKNLKKKKHPVEAVEIEADSNSTTPNNVKSLNNLLKNPHFNDKSKVVSPTPNTGNSKRKKSRITTSEMGMNGVELSPHTDSSQTKKRKLNSSDFEVISSGKENTLNSKKSDKKKSHLQFTVEELNVGTNRKKSRKCGEDWEVTDVSKNMKKVFKKNEVSSTSVQICEIPIKRKRSIDNIPDILERSKARKVNKTLKSDVEESPNLWLVQELCQLRKEKLSSEISGKYFPKTNEKSSFRSSENLPSETNEKSFSKSSEKPFDGENSFPKSNEKSPSKPSEKSPSKPSENLSTKSSKKSFCESNEKSPKSNENLCSESSQNLFPKLNEKSPLKSSEKLTSEKSVPKSSEKSPFKSSEKSPFKSSELSSNSSESFSKANEKSPSKLSESSSFISSQKVFPESSEKSPFKLSEKSSSGNEKSFSKSSKKSPKLSEISPSKQSVKSPSEPSEKSPYEPSEKSPSEPSEKSPSEPSEKSPSEPSEKSPSEPSEKSPSEPSEKSPSEPSEKSPSEPCEKSPSDPSEKSPSDPSEKSPSKQSETSSSESNQKSCEKSPFKSSGNISSVPNHKSPSKSAEEISPKSNKGESLSNLDNTVSSQVNEEIEPKKIYDITNKECSDIIDSVGGKQNNSAKIISVIELDVDDKNHTLERDGKYETKISGSGKNEKDESESLKEKKKENVGVMEADIELIPEKELLIAKPELNRYNLRKERINSPAKVGNNDKWALKNDSGKNKLGAKSSSEESVPKASSQIVEFTISSDSECGEQQKKETGVFRRITRSVAKRSSTPCRGSEKCIDIEELPSSQDGINIMKFNESTILEEESAAAGDSNVVLVESDESANLVLRIDSDRESVEINDIANEIKEKSKAAEKDKGEITISKDYALNKPNDLKKFKNSMKSEMEEVSTGMEAIENSPDVAVEDVASSDKEITVKKSSSTGEKEGSDSGSADEDILKTFIDVVSPKSE